MPRPYDLICLSHLRWDFVFQRPQHLLTRAARQHRVLFVEEPVAAGGPPRLDIVERGRNLTVAVPYLPDGLPESIAHASIRRMLDGLIEARDRGDYVLWFYTPMA